jgi:hypothetical protein
MTGQAVVAVTYRNLTLSHPSLVPAARGTAA